MKTPQVPIAKEGYPFCLLFGFITLVFAMLDYDLFAFVGLAVTVLTVNFFRDPERVVPTDEDALVSPADGKIIIVERVFDDRFVKEQVYKVSIFMNIFNVHVNRFPFPGKVESIIYKPGKFYSADNDRAALENESCALTVRTRSNQLLGVVQIAGLIARRIVCWAEAGDELRRGERFGLIRFGSRVDLYLPQNTQLEVEVGQKVKAGETVIGYLPVGSV